MPTFDVTFAVKYKRTIRLDADDEDSACEQADDIIREGWVPGIRDFDLDLYSVEIARKDDDA